MAQNNDDPNAKKSDTSFGTQMKQDAPKGIETLHANREGGKGKIGGISMDEAYDATGTQPTAQSPKPPETKQAEPESKFTQFKKWLFGEKAEAPKTTQTVAENVEKRPQQKPPTYPMGGIRG